MKEDISLPLVFWKGFLSFLSPDVLPILPAFLILIASLSFWNLKADANSHRIRLLTVSTSIAFLVGFFFVFVELGAGASMIGRFIFNGEYWIRLIGGILAIIFGLFIAIIIRLDIFPKERQLHFLSNPVACVVSFLVGMAFAASWRPQLGPILGTILLYASSKESAGYGFNLLIVYSFGFAIPFFLSSLLFNLIISSVPTIRKYITPFIILFGFLLVFFGVILLINSLDLLVTFFSEPDYSFKRLFYDTLHRVQELRFLQ